MPLEPYTAIICGKERQVRGFNGAGDRLLLTHGEEFTFEPLREKAVIPNTRLLAVSSLRWSAEGWLVDGISLDVWWKGLSGQESKRRSPLDARLSDLFLFLNDADASSGDRKATEAVAWFDGCDFSDGTGEPLLLRSFRAVPSEGVVTVPGQFRQEKPRDEAREADVLPPRRDFQRLKLRNKRTVLPPKAAREVLVALDTLGQRNVACAAIKQEVARMRGSKNTETPSDSYSPLKALRGSSVGRQILHPK